MVDGVDHRGNDERYFISGSLRVVGYDYSSAADDLWPREEPRNDSVLRRRHVRREFNRSQELAETRLLVKSHNIYFIRTLNPVITWFPVSETSN